MSATVTSAPVMNDIPRSRHKEAARVLAAAFTDDPVWRELRPKRPARAAAALYWIFRCEVLISALTGGHLLATYDADGRMTAVAIVFRRERAGFPLWPIPLRLPAMLLLGPSRVIQAARMAFTAEAHQPRTPHLYAYYAGATGLGGGAALIRRAMKIAKHYGLPAYGEAKSEEMLEIMKVLRWEIHAPMDIGYGRAMTPVHWTPPGVDEPVLGPSEPATLPAGPGLLGKLSGLATVAPKRFLAVLGILFVVFGVLGSPVATKLSAGGFLGAEAESSRAAAVLAEDFGFSGMQMILSVESEQGAMSPAVTAHAERIVSELRAHTDVEGVISPWSDPRARQALVSGDGRIGLIVVTVHGDDGTAPKAAHDLAQSHLGTTDGIEVRAGGQAILFHDVNTRAAQDLVLAEAIAMPLCFLLLVWFLRSVLAAAIPMIAGTVAIVGTTGILFALTFVTELSVFALNMTTAIGLALAIDYSLLIISRYREEIARGSAHTDAVAVATRNGGRTVLYSGLVVGIGVLGMAFFPMPFLKSIAYAGVAVVAFSVILAVTLVPALLLMFGERINRKPLRESVPAEQTVLYRIARTVQRRPVLFALPVLALLIGLGAPVLDLRIGLPDDRVLPADMAAHQVGVDIRERFTENPTGVVQIVLDGPGASDPAALDGYAAQVSRVDGVSGVLAGPGAYRDGQRLAAGDPAMVRAEAAYLVVSTSTDPYTDAALTQLDALREIPAPAPVLLGGLAQQTHDTATGVEEAFPKALIWIAVVTFLMVLLLTGSLLLPLKTLVLNTISLSATFGALVWIFQDGHLGALGTVPTGYLAATVPALVFCTAFGLSMDYEIFLAGRFKEEWEKSGKTRADNDTAVAVGLARSGRVITAAAVLMVVVFAAVITSEVSIMRMFGLGLALAVIVDATLVRMILVPAFMRLFGTWNWWAPGVLRPALDRFGLRE